MVGERAWQDKNPIDNVSGRTVSKALRCGSKPNSRRRNEKGPLSSERQFEGTKRTKRETRVV